MVALVGMVLVARPQLASAQNYTWSGTNALWTTSNWITSTGTTTFPGGSSGTNTAIINSGTVSFAGNDTFGNSATTSSPVIRLGSGGTLASGGFFNTLWNVNLNGGTLLANGGVSSSFPTFQLAGTLTVDGTTASSISVGGGSNNQVNIGGQGNATLTVNVADVTSSTAADLTVGTVLQNLSGGAGALTKTGAGTLELSAANTYTGATSVNGGVLRIASGGSLTSAGNINSTAGGQLVIAGSVTMAANTYFAVGNGISNTTGTTSIDGGSLNVGTSAFLIGGGRSDAGVGGLGTFVVNSGTVTVGAGGGAGGGQDTNAIYINPYATSGASQLVLNGGVFSTARRFSDGGGGQSLMAFNGGTLRLAANNINIGGAATNVIHSGGAVIDTNGFNGTLNLALSTGTGATAGGLTKMNSGTLTMSVANTYTGTTTVSGGVLRYGIANAISTGAVAVDSGATLDLATFNDSVGAVTLTSGNIIGTGTLTSTAGFAVTSGSISAPLAGAVGLTKAGAGTVTLSAVNPYTGATDINGGLLQIASGGALTSAGSINSTAGGRLSISGSVTMASNTYFAVGNGILNTTGTTSIDGGSLNVGGSAFLIGGSRSGLGATGGLGTFILNSGTVTVATGVSGGGQDVSAVWLNPYSSGTSQLILNGGVFSTARQIQNGSGSGDTTLAFNGGTLQLAADRANIAVSLSRVLIHSGGAVIDTNGFNGTFLDALTSGTGATAGGLTKLGSGTLTLSAANTYTGTTTISRGVLALSSAGSLASTSPVAITGSGATFNISGASAGRTIGMLTGTAGSTVVLGGNTLTVGDATSGAFAGVISGSGGLTKQGAGTLTLAGANTYSGATTVNAGVLVVGSGGSLSSAGNINTTGGGLLSIVGSVTTATNTYFAVGNGILNTTGTTTIDGGSLDVGTNAFLIGGSRAGMSGTNGLGTFVVNSGTVTVGASGGAGGGQDTTFIYLNPYGTSGTSQLVLNGGVFSIARAISDGGGGQSLMAYNGGTLRLSGSNINVGGGATNLIHSGGAVFDTNGFNGTLNMPLATGTGATPGGLTKIGSGTLTLSVANTFSGTTRVSAGVLSVTNANALQNSTLDLTSLDSGTITFGQNSTLGGLTGSRNLDMATRTLSIGNNNQSTTYSGTLSNGALTKLGSGTLTLSAANTALATTVSAGVLRLTGGNDRLSTSGTIALAGGTLDLGGNSQTTSGPVTFSGASSLTGGTLTTNNNTSLVPIGALTLGTSAAFVANQANQRLLLGLGTTNNFSLTGSAGSSFTVGGNADTAANYVGVDNGSATLTVNGPTLNFQVGAGQANATGGWLRIGANSGATGLVTLTAGTINIGHSASLGGHFQNSQTAAVTSSGTLTIAGGVFNVGTGTATTTAGGNNGYLYLKNDAAGSSGNAVVNLNGGVLSVKRIVPGTGGGTKQVNLDGGTILAAASDASFMNAAPGFSVNVGNGGGTIDTAGADITISTALLASGTGGIRKIGAGGLTLSGSNTYTGLTSVAAGLLKVNGSIDGELSVDNLAILGGSGTINGFVSIAGGGILAPGQSPGTLTMTSGLSLADASVLDYELVATDTTVGGGINDLTEVTGNFILDGILNVAGTGDFSTVPIGTKWRLFNYSGGTFTDNGLLLGSMPSLGSSDKSFEIDLATPGQVSLVVVPEPGGIAVAGIGVALAGWLRWRRRSSSLPRRRHSR